MSSLTFGITFSKRIAVVNSITVLRTDGYAAKILIEIQEEQFIATFVAQVHFVRMIQV